MNCIGLGQVLELLFSNFAGIILKVVGFVQSTLSISVFICSKDTPWTLKNSSFSRTELRIFVMLGCSEYLILARSIGSEM